MKLVAFAAVAALSVLSAATGCTRTPSTASPATPERTVKTDPAPITTTKELLRRLEALPWVEAAEAETTVGIPEANASTYETGRVIVVVKGSADVGECAARITTDFPDLMIGHELETSHMLVVGTADAFQAVQAFLQSGKAPDSFRKVSAG